MKSFTLQITCVECRHFFVFNKIKSILVQKVRHILYIQYVFRWFRFFHGSQQPTVTTVARKNSNPHQQPTKKDDHTNHHSADSISDDISRRSCKAGTVVVVKLTEQAHCAEERQLMSVESCRFYARNRNSVATRE